MREIVREWAKKGDSDFIAAKTLAPQKGVENQTGRIGRNLRAIAVMLLRSK
jgi:hypothetical protein